jgi:hypothetical protein
MEQAERGGSFRPGRAVILWIWLLTWLFGSADW